MRTPALLAYAATAAVSVSTASAQVEVIYTEIPGHPTAAAPGLGIDYTGFLDLHMSPAGTWWVFKAFINDVENDVIVVGTGTAGSIVAREADPTDLGGGTTHDFLDSDCGVNDSGVYAYGSRLLGATSTTDEIVFVYDTGLGMQVAAAREDDPAAGLTDFPPESAGDEIFGNALNSVHVLNSGDACFHADLIGNVDTNFRSALYQGSSPVAQEGTMANTGETYGGFIALSGDTFSSSADGESWIVEADIDPSVIGSIEAAVVNGNVMVADGDTFPVGSGLVVDAVFAVHMGGNGDWFTRGDYVGDNDWVVRNNVLIMESGDPILWGLGEAWGAAILSARGNGVGDCIIAGQTDNTDPNINEVVVLNRAAVVMRKGDPIDLDGNGMFDDNLRLRSFSPNDVWITDDLWVYAFVTLTDDTFAPNLGDAFVRVQVARPCPGDFDGNGSFDGIDVGQFLQAYATGSSFADLNKDGAINGIDVGLFLQAYGTHCS